MVTAVFPAPAPISPPQMAGGEVASGVSEADSEGRMDFGVLLAGLVTSPPSAVALGEGGQVAASEVAPLVETASEGGNPPVSSGEPVAVSPPSPVPSAPAAVPPPLADPQVDAVLDAREVPAEGAVVAPREPAGGAEASRGGASAESPPQGPAPAAMPLAAVLATEIVRQLVQHIGGGAPPGGTGEGTADAGARPAPAGSLSTPVLVEPSPAHRPGSIPMADPAIPMAPLAGLRELVAGPVIRAARGAAVAAEPAPLEGGDPTVAPATVSTEATPLHPTGSVGEATRRAVPPMAVPDRDAPPTIRASADGGTEPATPRGAAAADAAEVIRQVEGADDRPVAPSGADPEAAGAEAPGRAVSVPPAVGGGARELPAGSTRTAPPAPLLPAEPPPAPPVPTSHATVDLALGDGLTGRLRVAVRGDVVHATILAEGAAAVVLDRELPGLRRALAERGFPEAQVTVRATGAEGAALPPPPPSGTAPDRPTTGRDRDEGAPRHPHPDRQDPTEEQRSRERRRPPQPEEYP
jgi:hypothetical protein